MSRNKNTDASRYELLYLISNQYAEDEIKPLSDKVNEVIKNHGGEIRLAEEWGKRRLAYPIKHFSFGYYNLVEFEAPAEIIEKINKDLRLASEILRHQIVVKPVKSVETIKKEKVIFEKIAAKAAAKEKIEKEKEKSQDKGKVDLKDLDEKLDKILETDDLL